jgi:hypothetical protein
VRMSARVLGEAFGLTAQELNYALKEAGFLSGEPGMYSVTEMGAKFAAEEDHSRGIGGYAHYNRSWTTRTWDDSVADRLDLTDDRKREIRQGVSAARRAARAAMCSEAAVVDTSTSETVGAQGGANDVAVKATGALLASVAVYGIYKAVPHVQKFWNEMAAPGLKDLKDRVLSKPGAEEETCSEGKSSNPEEDR